MNAHPIFDRLDADLIEHGLAPSARPVAPCPLLPVRDLPADRSDDTRDAASTGV